jgi:hypothetical protein
MLARTIVAMALGVAVTKEARAKLRNAGSALSDFANAEMAYTSALVQQALAAGIVMIVLAAILAAFLCALLGLLLFGGMIFVPQVFPSLSQPLVWGIELGLMVLLTGAGCYCFWERTKELRKMLDQYVTHWRGNDATTQQK